MLDYLVMTPAEAGGVYNGLALAALLRQIVLNHGPAVIIFINVWVIVYRFIGQPHLLRRLAIYWTTSFLLVVGFWPDITPFAQRTLRPVSAAGIGSYAALQDPEAEVRTAEDTQMIPPELDRSTLEPPLFRLLLVNAVRMPLFLGRFLNAQAHRPLAGLMPMQWMLGQELPAEIMRNLTDWIEQCYKPSLLTDQEFQEAVTSEQLMPWGDTPVARALASKAVMPGGAVSKGYFRNNTPLGLAFLANPDSPASVPCTTYLSAMELEVQRLLFRTTTPNGTPISQVFDETYGMNATQQARMLIHLQMLRAMRGPVPAPSLAGAYATLSGDGAVAGALAPARGGGKSGAALGAGSGVLTQAEAHVQRLLTWVGWAMWLAYWLPDIMGQTLMLVIGLFPVVFLFMLWSGQVVRVFLGYALTLFLACCSPLWFALIDLDARAASARALQFDDPILQLLNWAPQQLAFVVHTVIGLSLIPVVTAGLLFVGLRYGVPSLISSVTRSA